MVKRPCLDCGTPARSSRCEPCAVKHDQIVNARETERRRGEGVRQRRRSYGGTYRRAAAAIRATATRCWICGQGPRAGDPWQADHVVPLALAPDQAGRTPHLAPAHRSCNVARSNRGRANGTH